MVIIVVVRRCFCEVCNGSFDLESDEDLPKKCKLCGSTVWEEAPEIRDAIYIRKGLATKKKRLNPGATSRKRQTQGKKQYRQFRTKEEDAANRKPVDSSTETS